MAKTHGRQAVVLFDQYDLSAWLTSYEGADDVDIPDTSCIGGSTARRYEVVGLRGGTMSLSGHYDPAAGASQAVLNAAFAQAAARVVSAFPQGDTIGLPADLMSARETSLSAGTPVDGVASISAQAVGDGGKEFGVSLHSRAAAVTTSGDSASVDQLAQSANGGVGHIHCTVAAADTIDVDIEDSADDETFATLITFAQITTTAAAERVEVTGTVEQYVRETHALGVSGPYTYAVAFARR